MFIGWEPKLEELVTGDQKYTAKWEKIDYKITYSPNGGSYTIPSSGEGKISTKIEAIDTEGKETNKLEYVWSNSSEKAPETGWEEFTNGSKIEKTGITEPETWYLWVKITDKEERVVETAKSEEFAVGSNEEEANQITLIPDQTKWTNEDIEVTVSYGENLVQNKKVTCTGTEGVDYIIDGVDRVIIKTNEQTIVVEAEDIAGNKVTETTTISKIDKILPTVALEPNGGNYVMLTEEIGELSVKLTAEDIGGSDLEMLQYAWSESREEEPEEWIDFTNETEIEKTDIEEAGTWYLWTKVTDNAGNRAESIKVSEAFIIKTSNAEENKITLTPNKTEWTNEDVIVTATYGENLVQNKKITCTGTEGIDYTIDGVDRVIVKTNEQKITAEAEDIVGNKVTETITISKIDKILPTVALEPNGGNYVILEEESAEVSVEVTAEDIGGSDLEMLQYAWSDSREKEPAEWMDFTNETEVEKTDIEEAGTWYLWTKVTDNAGNRAESTKVSEAFIVKSSEAEANKITLTPNKTEWTNEDIEVTATYGENLVQNKKLICTGTEGVDYIIDGVNRVIIKTNGKTVTAISKDREGNEVTSTLTVSNIDKMLPTVELAPNGGANYTMPSKGQARISTTLTAIDPEKTETNGCSTLDILAYAWSQSKEIEPEEWIDFTNETEIEKTDIEEAGTWYLWTKVTDNAGNRAESIKVSNPFTITANIGEGANPANQITLKPSKIGWTNEDVIVTATYGENLVQNRTLTCDGTEAECTVNGIESVEVKENGKTVTAMAEDIAGNIVETKLIISEIDKILPTVALEPNGGNYVIPSEGSAKVNVELTAEDMGGSGLAILQYAWGKSDEQEPEEWMDFTNETEIEKADIDTAGTWYLWTKVTDNAGNRAEEIKVSEAFIVQSSNDEPGKIILSRKTAWTNKDVTVTAIFGANLTGAELICDGTEGVDYTVNGTTSATVKTNGKTVTATAQGVEEETKATVENIDRLAPSSVKILKTTPTTNSIKVEATAEDAVATDTDGCSGIAKYYFSIDGGETWTVGQTSATYTFTGLTQNKEYSIKVKAVDNAKNEKESEVNRVRTGTVPGLVKDTNLSIDWTPTTWTNGKVTVTMSTTVKGYTLQYSIDGKKTWTNYKKFTVANNNTTIYARLKDSSGNTGAEATATVDKIDRLPPNNVEIDTTKTTTTTNSIKVVAKATDAPATTTNGSSGIAKYYFSKDGGTTWEPSDGQKSATYTFTKLTQSTTYSIKVKALDNANNEKTSGASNIKTSTVPKASGNVTFTNNPTGWTKNNVSVTITKVAAVKDYTLQYSIDGGTWKNYTSAVTMSVNGSIYARLVDSNGNAGAKATGSVTKIDKKAPTVTIDTTKTTTTTNSIKVVATAKDVAKTETNGCSGIALYYFSKDGGTTWEPSNGQKSGTYTFTELAHNTSYKIQVKAVDNAKNEGKSASTTIKTDTVPGLVKDKNVTIKYTPTTWTNEKVTVTMSTTVTGYTLQYSIDGKSWTNYTKFTVANNNTTIHARLKDSSGNTGTEATVKIEKIDRLNPKSVTISKTTTTTNSIKVEATAEDAAATTTNGSSGIEKYYFSKDGGTTWTAGQTSGTYTFTGLKQSTSYKIQVKAVDNAKNEKETGVKSITTLTMPKASGNVTFEYNPTIWTKGTVSVTITKVAAVKDYTLQYSTDGKTWKDYTSAVKMSENGSIYARLKDSSGNTGAVATGNVTKIDKVAPTINTALSATASTTEAGIVTFNIKVTDKNSGLGKIIWYYKLSTADTYTSKTDIYTTMNGENAGTTTSIEKSKGLTLKANSIYNVYAIVYDVAGNSTRSPASGTVKVTTPVARWKNESTSKQYTTMAAAFNAASAGDTLTLLSNYTDNSAPSLNKKVKLNLNGKTLTKTVSTINIASGGNLELTGSGKITSQLTTITNNGTLNLTSGTVEQTGSTDKCAIWNKGTFNMSGGSIRANGDGIMNDGSNGYVYIYNKNATIYSETQCAIWNLSTKANYSVYITAGTFTSNASKTQGNGEGATAISNKSSTKIKMTGGTVKQTYGCAAFGVNGSGNIEADNIIFTASKTVSYGTYNGGTVSGRLILNGNRINP